MGTIRNHCLPKHTLIVFLFYSPSIGLEEIGVGVEFLGPVELRDDDLQLRCALPLHQEDGVKSALDSSLG